MMSRVALAGVVAVLMTAGRAGAQREITINIYNDGFSQITEERGITVQSGGQEIELRDIAEKIDPGSITLSGNDFDVRWIDYRYDFVSAERLLFRFIGHEVQIQKDDSLIKGVLVRYDDDYLFLAAQGWPGPVSIFERDDLKNIDLPELPAGLVSRPTIAAGIESPESKTAQLKLSYLTTGLGWQAEYRLEFDGGVKGDFSGWVSLDNQSGISFPDATVILVAGQVDRTEPTAVSGDQFAEGTIGKTAEAPLEPLVDYHRYRLPFEVSVGEKESKQAALFQPLSMTVEHYYKYKWSETKSAVKSVISFENNEESGLGFPLPPGRISLTDGETGTFLGSGEFEGAPAGEEAEVFMGTAFDIKAERKRIDHRKISRNRNSDTFEIEVRNHKSKDIRLVIEEELYGYWEIVEKSDDFTKKDFQTVEFEIDVPGGGEKTVTYTVEYSY
jgi:hypothetical protein